MSKHELLTTVATAVLPPPGGAALRALRRRDHRAVARGGVGALAKVPAAAVVAAAAGLALTSGGRQAGRRILREVDRKTRYLAGRAEGIWYRMRNGGPDPNVPDSVLADRVRSTLGPLERDLDIPHVHVMVVDKVALLHGDVDVPEAATRIEKAVERVPGVRAVRSYLHVGLLPGDTRPSEGRRHQPPSELLRRLIDAAATAGISPDDARRVVRTVLSVLADRLPADERAHLFGHLAADVRSMLEPPRRRGDVDRIRSIEDFAARVAADAGLSADQAGRVTVAVFAVLRDAVPEEDDDVAAVLPADLRALWQSAGPQATAS